MVRAAGVEPARAFRLYGFSYHFGFRRRRRRSWSGLSLRHSRKALGAARLVSTPSRETVAPAGLARDRHLTGFPEFERFYVRRFRRRTQVFSSSPLRLPIPPRPRSRLGLP